MREGTRGTEPEAFIPITGTGPGMVLMDLLQGIRRWRPIFVNLYWREVTARYISSLSGFLWVLINPLAQLGIYAYVFAVIFKARFPEAETTGFVPYLALALWPWIAFAEGLNRAATCIQDNGALVNKVAIPHDVFVITNVAATFSIHVAGYCFILLILALLGVEFHWVRFPIVIYFLLLLSVLCLALSYLVAATQVFVKDLQHALGPVLTLMFFVTPIVYPPSLVPEYLRQWIYLNPIAYITDSIRSVMLHDVWMVGLVDLAALVATASLLWFGWWFFRRCSPRFHDFL